MPKDGSFKLSMLGSTRDLPLPGTGKNLWDSVACSSVHFLLQISNSRQKRQYQQIWRQNMQQVGEAKYKEGDCSDSILIVWLPDYALYGVNSADQDIRMLFSRRVCDRQSILEGQMTELIIFSCHDCSRICVAEWSTSSRSRSPIHTLHRDLLHRNCVKIQCDHRLQRSHLLSFAWSARSYGADRQHSDRLHDKHSLHRGCDLASYRANRKRTP